MIKKGDKVAVDYEGRYEDGEVFDSSSHEGHSHPLVFVVGSGQVIAGFDDAVLGMNQNETKEFTILPENAYGRYEDKLKQDVPRETVQLPDNRKPEVGMMLMVRTAEGFEMPVRVAGVTDSHVTFDLNHPLAGKTLIFKITVVGINDSIKADTHSH